MYFKLKSIHLNESCREKRFTDVPSNPSFTALALSLSDATSLILSAEVKTSPAAYESEHTMRKLAWTFAVRIYVLTAVFQRRDSNV